MMQVTLLPPYSITRHTCLAACLGAQAPPPPSLINSKMRHYAYGRYMDPREVSGHNNKQQTNSHTYTHSTNQPVEWGDESWLAAAARESPLPVGRVIFRDAGLGGGGLGRYILLYGIYIRVLTTPTDAVLSTITLFDHGVFSVPFLHLNGCVLTLVRPLSVCLSLEL